MSLIQPLILKAEHGYASFLRFSLVNPASLATCLAELPKVYQIDDSVVGFGQPLLAQLKADIPGVKAASSIQGINRISPANQDDLWLRFSDQENINSYKILKSEYDRLQHKYKSFDTLSIGMSNDYKLAISNESNMIRLGSIIFGRK